MIQSDECLVEVVCKEYIERVQQAATQRMILKNKLPRTLVSPCPHGKLLGDNKDKSISIDAPAAEPDPLSFSLAMKSLIDLLAACSFRRHKCLR